MKAPTIPPIVSIQTYVSINFFCACGACAQSVHLSVFIMKCSVVKTYSLADPRASSHPMPRTIHFQFL